MVSHAELSIYGNSHHINMNTVEISWSKPSSSYLLPSLPLKILVENSRSIIVAIAESIRNSKLDEWVTHNKLTYPGPTTRGKYQG